MTAAGKSSLTSRERQACWSEPGVFSPTAQHETTLRSPPRRCPPVFNPLQGKSLVLLVDPFLRFLLRCLGSLFKSRFPSWNDLMFILYLSHVHRVRSLRVRYNDLALPSLIQSTIPHMWLLLTCSRYRNNAVIHVRSWGCSGSSKL